jgi:chemotaxis protein methyltransferase CheR
VRCNVGEYVKNPASEPVMAFAEFFHDSQTLELLIERATPVLCSQPCPRIWNAVCGNGAELYTLAMLLRERLPDRAFRTLRIHATDVDFRLGLPIAEGMYPERDVKRIPYPIRYRSFQVTDKPGYVQAVDELRTRVTFGQHELLSLVPPRQDFSAVVCTNVSSHLDETERRQVFRMFYQAMYPGGLLATDQMPANLDSLFEPVSSHAQIYRRLDVSESIQSHIDGPHAPGVRVPKETHRVRTF